MPRAIHKSKLNLLTTPQRCHKRRKPKVQRYTPGLALWVLVQSSSRQLSRQCSNYIVYIDPWYSAWGWRRAELTHLDSFYHCRHGQGTQRWYSADEPQMMMAP
jgi:hypothetical protein